MRLYFYGPVTKILLKDRSNTFIVIITRVLHLYTCAIHCVAFVAHPAALCFQVVRPFVRA